MNKDILVFLDLVFLYFLPSSLVFNRGDSEEYRSEVIRLNLALGWTFIGWILAISSALLEFYNGVTISNKPFWRYGEIIIMMLYSLLALYNAYFWFFLSGF